MNAQFITDLANVLEAPIDAFNDEWPVQNGDSWDSLALISTVSLIDKYFGVFINSDDLNKVKNVGELKTLVLKNININ